jgi:hypothetical protein
MGSMALESGKAQILAQMAIAAQHAPTVARLKLRVR